jgi:PAP2 superfamily
MTTLATAGPAVVHRPMPARSATARGRAALRCGYELALLAALYAGYVVARSAIGVHPVVAHERGRQILDLERFLHLDVEGDLNHLAIAVPVVGLVLAYLYATLHYVVTPAVLLWTALRRRGGSVRALNALLVATSLGLVCYWLLPTAPPRLLGAGFTDVMAYFSDVGWWGDAASAPRGMEGLTNQFAAFPSLHVGWAMWVALTLRDNLRSTRLRRWVWVYPALMCVDVMATANHYLLDALAGIGCVCAGHWVARLVESCRR